MEASRAPNPALVQAEERSVDGESESSPRPIAYGLRRSCNACGRKKRKCDAERPSCRRCLRAGEECVYSKRMCHLPTAQQQPTPGAVVEHGDILPFKRCTLSASPATGLVGMQENGFLSDFFGCVGFLPLTTTSHIRETMVNIMLAPASRQQAALGTGADEAVYPDAAAMSGGFGSMFGGRELPMNPSTCIFWCAVAVGALVKGAPIESVASYSQLAADALDRRHSGPPDAEVAMSWTILAFLHDFTGDLAKFREYLTLSDSFLIACIEQGSTDMLPVGFAEKLQSRSEHDALRCDSTVYSFYSQVPQLNTGASDHEMFRHMMRSFQGFENTIRDILLEKSAADEETPGGTEAPPPSEGSADPHPVSDDQVDVFSDALVNAWVRGNKFQLEPVEDEVDRSSIGGGMGGLLVYGFLFYVAAARGDVPSTLKGLGRCLDVFVRYPGLCRSVMGAHEAHELLAALAALDDSRAREMYDTMRDIYNPFRPRGKSPAPPLEEWRGMSCICDSLYCKSIGKVVASDKMRVFSHPAGGMGANDTDGDQGEEFGAVASPNQSGLLASSVDPDEEEIASANWLDVTHAMLDAGNESYQAGSI